MGIRINKVLGYGIKDFKGFGKDPRISKEFNYAEFCEKGDKESLNEFSKYFEQAFKKAKEENKKGYHDYFDYSTAWHYYIKDYKHKTWQSFLHYDDEYNGSTLLIGCPFFNDWFRHDDIIDYYECNVLNKGSFDSVLDIEGGIYPYSGGFYNVETDEPLSRGIEILQYKNYKKEKRISKKNLHNTMNNYCQDVLGFSYDHFLAQYNVKIPVIIFEYLKFINLFKNETEIKKLKPLLYTYWR